MQRIGYTNSSRTPKSKSTVKQLKSFPARSHYQPQAGGTKEGSSDMGIQNLGSLGKAGPWQACLMRTRVTETTQLLLKMPTMAQKRRNPLGSPFFLLFSVLCVPPMPNLSVTQLTEEPEKRSCQNSPIVTQSKSGEGQEMDLRVNKPWTAHASVLKTHLLEDHLNFF